MSSPLPREGSRAEVAEDVQRLAACRERLQPCGIADGDAGSVELRDAVTRNAANGLAEGGIGLAVDRDPVVDDRIHGEAEAEVGTTIESLRKTFGRPIPVIAVPSPVATKPPSGRPWRPRSPIHWLCTAGVAGSRTFLMAVKPVQGLSPHKAAVARIGSACTRRPVNAACTMFSASGLSWRRKAYEFRPTDGSTAGVPGSSKSCAERDLGEQPVTALAVGRLDEYVLGTPRHHCG